MKRRVVEATAPTRLDLAGRVPFGARQQSASGAVGVALAVDRRVWCRVETGVPGVEIESKDALRKVSAASVAEVIAAGQLALAAHVLQALGVETGVRVVTQARVPEETGLATGAALAVALTAATAEALGRQLSVDETWQFARDADAAARGCAAAIHDCLPAIVGGACCAHGAATGARLELLAVDPGRVEECLLLVDSGSSQPERSTQPGDADGHEWLARIAGAAHGVREALLAGRYEDVVGLIAEEWEATVRVVPRPTPEVQRVIEIVRSAGGAAKPAGAGSGRIVIVWAPPGARRPGRREAVLEATKAAGLRTFPARVDMRGLEVEAGA